MKKLILTGLVIFLIAIFTFSVGSADSVIVDNGIFCESYDIVWSVYDDGTMIIEGNGVIPSFSNSSQVPYSEYFNKGIVKELVIKGKITEIGDYAFYGCSAETVEIASTVRKIGNYSFYGLKNVQNISLSENVSSIGDGAFSASAELSVTVDGSNKYFSVDEFGILYDYEKTEIIFCPCGSKLLNYEFPDTLINIRNEAFNGAVNLKEICLPLSLKSIGSGAFKNCANLTKVILNYGLEEIGVNAFEGCTDLNEIYYYSTESNLLKISMDNCGLEGKEISCNFCKHNNITETDGVSAECNKPGYTGAELCRECGVYVGSKQVTTVPHRDTDNDNICDVCGEEYCTAVESGFFSEEDDSIIWVLYDNGNLIVYGRGEMTDYSPAKAPYYEFRDSINRITVGNEITYIGAYSFYGLNNLETVCGGNGVTSLGEGAFENAVRLTEVNAFANLEYIDDKAFYNCSLSEWNFSSKIKAIGSESFYGCKFRSVILSDSVETLGDRAFCFCVSLENIFIGEKVSLIGADVFGKCNSLSKIKVDGFNTVYCDDEGVLFRKNFTELLRYPPAVPSASYRIPDSIKKISDGAFSDCINLKTVALNDGLITIGDFAFSGCSSVCSVDIPYGVGEIGDGAFSYCTNLENIIISLSVTSLGEYAFCGCRALEEITLSSGITKLSSGLFSRCTNLNKVTVSGKITEIEKDAFEFCESLGIVIFENETVNLNEITVDSIGNDAYLSASKHLSSHRITNTEEVLPICVNAGYTAGEYCKECKYYLSGHKIIEAEYEEHSLGDYSVYTESTCTAIGEERAYCLRNCGYYESRSAEMKDHEYSVSVIPATCNNPGYYAYVCSCGHYYLEKYEDALGHHLSEYYDVVSALCTAEGKERADCLRCSYYKEKTILASGHSYSVTSVVLPTCTTDGYSVYTCSCGDSYKSDYNAMLYHEFSNAFSTDTVPTCCKKGSESRHCIRCDERTDVRDINVIAHSFTERYSAATLYSDGSRIKSCSVCSEVLSSDRIYRIKSAELSDSSYIYNGKSKKPSVTVKDVNGTILKEGTDYTVEYQSGRKKVGKYSVTVTFTGRYSGTVVKSFEIVPVAVKKLTSEPSIRNITLSWTKVKGATGYRIYYYNSKTKKYEAIKDTKNLSYTVNKINSKNLKSGTSYKFAVKAYSEKDDTKVFSSRKAIKTATKPEKAMLKSAVSSSGRIKVRWKKMNCDGYELVYATNKSFSSKKTVIIGKSSTAQYVLKGIPKGKNCFVKIRAYKVIGGKKFYGYYSNPKNVKVK